MRHNSLIVTQTNKLVLHMLKRSSVNLVCESSRFVENEGVGTKFGGQRKLHH